MRRSYMTIEKWFDDVRDDPRFRGVVDQLGLPE
jgi:hypothetical protein